MKEDLKRGFIKMRVKWLSTIRVFGLLLVLLYHFFIKWFPGGFLGVDLFFTLSGFLMTSLLIDQYISRKRIEVVHFFRKRLYRILPALVLMVLIIPPLSLLVRDDFRAQLASQLAATLGFITNFYEILAGNGYENQFTPHLFVHTWTLAIEVQLYLFWILTIWGMARLARTIGQLRGMIFLTASSLFLVGFISMFTASFFVESFSTIYFSPLTHTFPFFLGAILATLSGIQYPSKSFQGITSQWSVKQTLLVLLGGFAILTLLALILPFNHLATYLVGFLLASLATVAMIYAARILHEQRPDLVEPIFLTIIADLSYGLYLFHWPFYLIFKEMFPQTWALVLTLICSMALSSLSFYIIEPYLAGKPIRILGQERSLESYNKTIWTGVGLLTLITLIISLTAPKLGTFEKEMLVGNLQQANNKMNATRIAAENAQATDYNIQEGVTIFGDSVTVRASSNIQELLPQVQVDGTVSRHLTEISNLVKLYKDSNTLKETVVVALGTNTSQEYKELLDQLITEFPKGHRLIFVTPYDGNYSVPEESIAYLTGQYEKQLANELDYVSVADWAQVSIDNPHIWEDSDLVHYNMSTNGGDLFAQTILTATQAATDSPVKK